MWITFFISKNIFISIMQMRRVCINNKFSTKIMLMYQHKLEIISFLHKNNRVMSMFYFKILLKTFTTKK